MSQDGHYAPFRDFTHPFYRIYRFPVPVTRMTAPHVAHTGGPVQVATPLPVSTALPLRLGPRCTATPHWVHPFGYLPHRTAPPHVTCYPTYPATHTLPTVLPHCDLDHTHCTHYTPDIRCTGRPVPPPPAPVLVPSTTLRLPATRDGSPHHGSLPSTAGSASARSPLSPFPAFPGLPHRACRTGSPHHGPRCTYLRVLPRFATITTRIRTLRTTHTAHTTPTLPRTHRLTTLHYHAFAPPGLPDTVVTATHLHGTTPERQPGHTGRCCRYLPRFVHLLCTPTTHPPCHMVTCYALHRLLGPTVPALRLPPHPEHHRCCYTATLPPTHHTRPTVLTGLRTDVHHHHWTPHLPHHPPHTRTLPAHHTHGHHGTPVGPYRPVPSLPVSATTRRGTPHTTSHPRLLPTRYPAPVGSTAGTAHRTAWTRLSYTPHLGLTYHFCHTLPHTGPHRLHCYCATTCGHLWITAVFPDYLGHMPACPTGPPFPGPHTFCPPPSWPSGWDHWACHTPVLHGPAPCTRTPRTPHRRLVSSLTPLHLWTLLPFPLPFAIYTVHALPGSHSGYHTAAIAITLPDSFRRLRLLPSCHWLPLTTTRTTPHTTLPHTCLHTPHRLSFCIRYVVRAHLPRGLRLYCRHTLQTPHLLPCLHAHHYARHPTHTRSWPPVRTPHLHLRGA